MTSTLDPDIENATDDGADAFAERVFAATLGTMETLSMYIGDRLGWYRSLADHGPSTAYELADRTATDERYAREWLEQQAVVGILTVEQADGEHRFTLPPGAAEVLTDQHSLAYLGPLPRMFAAVGAHLPELLDSYRSGDGVSWEQLGDDARTGQAEINRPWFEQRLGDAIRAVPAVHDVLDRTDARVLDVGCGAGWSTIALAQAYPSASVLGVDIDAPSIEMARRNAAAVGVTDRVSFRVADAGSLAEEGGFDAAFAFECVHDMPRPVSVLDAVRRSVRPDGVVVVMDERVADDFTAPGDDVERFMYGFSLVVCLPDGRSSAPSAATGTVMRAPTLRRYAQEAGFADLEVLPIDDFSFFRFYLLTR